MLLAGLSGCGGAPQNKEAVRRGIMEHLSKRTDMLVSSMQIDVVSVSFRKGEADAVISFRPSGAAAETGMTMSYTLESKGRQWVVKTRRDAGGHEKGAMPQSQLPADHPAIPGKPQGGAAKQ